MHRLNIVCFVIDDAFIVKVLCHSMHRVGFILIMMQYCSENEKHNYAFQVVPCFARAGHICRLLDNPQCYKYCTMWCNLHMYECINHAMFVFCINLAAAILLTMKHSSMDFILTQIMIRLRKCCTTNSQMRLFFLRYTLPNLEIRCDVTRGRLRVSLWATLKLFFFFWPWFHTLHTLFYG